MPRSVATQLCLSRGVTCENTFIFHGIRVPASKSQLKPVKQGHSMQLSARRPPTHVRNYLWPFRCYALYVRHGLSPTTNPPSPLPSPRCAGCFFYVSDFLDYWIENLFTFVRIHLCPAQPGHGLALDSPRTDARTLSLLLIVYPSFTLPLSLSLSYCYLSSLRRQCKIFWHKVNSIFDYYLNRFLSHWAQQCSVPSSRRCYSSRCCCCCRSYAHACDMSYSCLFTEPTRNAAHKRDLKEKI